MKYKEILTSLNARVGGPLTFKVLNKYPGNDEFIKHLEKEYGYENRTGLKPWQLIKMKMLDQQSSNTHPMLLSKKNTDGSSNAIINLSGIGGGSYYQKTGDMRSGSISMSKSHINR